MMPDVQNKDRIEPIASWLPLLELVTKQEWCDLNELCAQLNVSQPLLGNKLQYLQTLGLAFDIHSKRGVRLLSGFEPLDMRALKRPNIHCIDYFLTVGSTNDWLWEQGVKKDISVAISEHQGAGKGRFNRDWQTMASSSLAISVSRCIEAPIKAFQALAQKVVLSVMFALDQAGETLQVKWPNDILLNGRKLAGILIETKVKSQMTEVVIGLGLNMNRQDRDISVNRPVAYLSEIANQPVDRQKTVTTVLAKIYETLDHICFTPEVSIIEQWQRVDALFNREVVLETGQGKKIAGKVKGNNAAGALILLDSHTGLLQEHASGTLSHWQ